MKNYIDLQKNVISQKLCCFCGTCVGICPVKKIYSINETIKFNQSTCLNCGRCVSVCPGAEFNFPHYTNTLFNPSSYIKDPTIGSYLRIVKAHANSSRIRKGASSGGCVTSIALYLLQQQKIDGVIGVVLSEVDNTKSEVRILRTEEDVYKMMQSKYVLLPVNSIINEILHTEGIYLFIGLPCQIQGMRKAMEINKALREKIYLCIALFCGFNMRYEATEFLINKSKFPKKDILSIEYRGKKNSETGFIAKTSKKDFFLSKHEYTLLNVFFSPERCWKCYDLSGEFADISCGDAWEMDGGWTRLIIRSHAANELIDELSEKQEIQLLESNINDITTSQKKIISYKKKEILIRQKLFKPFPDYHISFDSLSVKQTIKAFLFSLCLLLGKSRISKKILKIIPTDCIRFLSKNLRCGNSDNFKEVIRYLFWGIITVLVSITSFATFRSIKIEYKTANLLSIILTKLVAFISNKKFVFQSNSTTLKENFNEIFHFILARGATGIIEFLGLIVWVDILSLQEIPGKILFLIITTILNYILSKYFVFNSDTTKPL